MNDSRIPALLRWAFWSTAMAAVALALTPKPPRIPLDRFGDKVEHMIAFAVLALLASLAYRATPRQLIVERLSFLGAAIEVLQSIPALHRDCDVRDWIADTFAVVVVTLIVRAVQRRNSGGSQA